MRTIPKEKIQEMNKKEVLKEIEKAEYKKVFDDRTWALLQKRLRLIKNE